MSLLADWWANEWLPVPPGGSALNVVCEEVKIIQVKSIDHYDWIDILGESQAEGYNLVNRLLTDFRSGKNKFSAPGEVLVAYISSKSVIAVAGLNQEPDNKISRAGRIRRLYVLPKYRGKGLGRGLVEYIVQSAESHFEKITVNVGELDISGFYEHLGFSRSDNPGITHVKELAHSKAMQINAESSSC